MTGGVAERFAAQRVALVGEAAHVLPPIGAQGLNLGFRDVATLDELLSSRLSDPGAATIIDRYESRRRLDIEGRWTMVDLLNRSLLTGFLPAQIVRSTGLELARTVPLFRNILMKQGLGSSNLYGTADISAQTPQTSPNYP